MNEKSKLKRKIGRLRANIVLLVCIVCVHIICTLLCVSTNSLLVLGTAIVFDVILYVWIAVCAAFVLLHIFDIQKTIK